MRQESTTIEQVGTKDVTTRFGTKPTYSFKADGVWYSTGFKKAAVSAGDVVSFNYEETKYGKEVDPKSVVIGAAPAATAVAAPAARAPSFSRGGFPIPALDGQRSIIRQNALTNARELYVGAAGGKPFPVDSTATTKAIIDIARKFEAYSAGDLDAAEAAAELET
jgi:hypothetical protein